MKIRRRASWPWGRQKFLKQAQRKITIKEEADESDYIKSNIYSSKESQMSNLRIGKAILSTRD